MLCSECGKKTATIHLTKIINGEKTELHLCEDCAKNNKYLEDHFNDSPLLFNQFFTGLVDNNGEESIKKKYTDIIQCPRCGMTYDQFRKIGRFGCPKCYETFKFKIKSLYKRLHGHEEHIGKLPRKSSGKIKIAKEIDKLKKELDIVVSKEEFEQAVILRDKIKELNQKLEGCK
ncbi:UvrB/UvrC motif-containing protein [Abyssisolibacter fermentans]|uniref:UvrB/UvrC motif-containing protein n=1 Tax=Abyssisolibacter fermentans TaxID=1766203 RepID=UPI0008317F39|nr:UvrB/UvrC motif-containing protein [Abyssisolibacter fermentans]